MSAYLIDRLKSLPNVEIITGVEVDSLEGKEGALEAIGWRHRRTGELTRRSVSQLFLFIGADPNTDWLSGSHIALDQHGFVRTGPELGDRLSHETSRRGVFAVGDVRCGSVKRVAAAAGDGAQVVSNIHRYLADRAVATAEVPAHETRGLATTAG
jgi:thioredoxin reductase (NADPH)